MQRLKTVFILGLLVALGTLMDTSAQAQSFPTKHGSFWIFLERPISLACLVFAILLLASAVLPALRARRERIAVEAN